MKIKVRVIPRSKKLKIEEFDGGLKVYISDPAIEGRANKGLIEVLAEYYQLKKYNIHIIKGEKNRDKVVEIEK
ncbi:MAG: DUF167 domain-containing protein [Candidatus Omnitrophica bacterium]|nr:DUF167 domain-containing protein [Candidatus Omnitrophota bacterium]